MAITSSFSGNIKRYNGDDIEKTHPVSVTKTITEGGDNRVLVAPGSKDISIMPSGVLKATSVYIEAPFKLNVSLFGDNNASFDVLADGVVYINGSFSNVKLWNQGTASGETTYYDISG